MTYFIMMGDPKHNGSKIESEWEKRLWSTLHSARAKAGKVFITNWLQKYEFPEQLI